MKRLLYIPVALIVVFGFPGFLSGVAAGMLLVIGALDIGTVLATNAHQKETSLNRQVEGGRGEL